jgi:hypothetical protein
VREPPKAPAATRATGRESSPPTRR